MFKTDAPLRDHRAHEFSNLLITTFCPDMNSDVHDLRQKMTDFKGCKMVEVREAEWHATASLMPTRSSPELKCALLELGETKMLWDTATSQRLFSHLYRCLADGFLPYQGIGPDAPVGDPFHIQMDLWDARITIQSLLYRLADTDSSPRDEKLFGPIAGPSVLGAMSFEN